MWNDYVALVDGFKLTTILILVLVDFVLGVIVALKEHTFQFSKIADFLNTTVLTMVGGYFLIGGVALVHPDFSALVTGAWIILDAALLAGIWGKAGKLGLPTPKFISE